MVATLPHNEDRFAQPLMISIAGKPARFETKSALFRAIRGIEADAIAHNLRHARAVFHLGQAINEAAEKLGYGSKNHLYNECGLNARRAQKAIRFAEILADDEGGFSIEKFRMWERKILQMRERGEMGCKLDSQGTPSVNAFETVLGLRTQRKPKSERAFASDDRAQTAQNDPRVASAAPAYRPMSDILGGSALGTHRAFTAPGPAGVPDHAQQLVIDFDLDATADTLASRAHEAARLQRDRAITTDQAARINAVLEDAGAAIDQIIHTHTGS